jgi:hypothetical protein
MDNNFWISLGLVIIMGGLIYYTRILCKSFQNQSRALIDQTQAMYDLTEAIITFQSRLQSIMTERELTEKQEADAKLQRRIRRDE